MGNTRNCIWLRSIPLGSPPHAWGIRVCGTCVERREAVHPHTRGEYATSRATSVTSGRFTPTRVGNTSLASPNFSPMSGSPPHAWGIRKGGGQFTPDNRFTPTRVGNTAGAFLVHVATPGSPPHAWGIRHELVGNQVAARFTPTRVGNTHGAIGDQLIRHGSPPHAWGIRGRRQLGRRFRAVHPHTRGEYEDRRGPGDSARRFTPTRVGNTLRWWRSIWPTRGSPPHAWGIR